MREDGRGGRERKPSKWALRYKRGITGGTEEAGKREKPKSRLSRRAGANIPTPPTFLYVASESDQAGSRGEVEVVRDRIVRKTVRKILVEREPLREEERPGREEHVPPPEGRARSRRRWPSTAKR
jgi:hypothetical protein